MVLEGKKVISMFVYFGCNLIMVRLKTLLQSNLLSLSSSVCDH